MARAKEYFIFNKLRESVNPSLHVATDLEFLRVSYGNGGMARISCFRRAVGDVFRYASSDPTADFGISHIRVTESVKSNGQAV